MQGKGLIRFFLVFMILIAIYQFLLIIPTNTVENRAVSQAQAACIDESASMKGICEKKYEQDYLDSISGENVFDLGVLTYTYEELKKQQLNLGLDLKGGMSVVLQVDLRDLIKVLGDGQDKTDDDFSKALELATQKQAAASTDYVTLFRESFEELARNRKLAEIFAVNPDLKDENISLSSSNAEVASLIRTKATSTVDLTFKRLKQRIDKFGVTQPNVTLDNTTDRIIVELPGIDNPNRARSFLQASAKLEFWHVYELDEIFNGLQQTEDYFKRQEEAKQNTDATSETDTETTDETVDEPTTEGENVETAETTTVDSPEVAAPETDPALDLGPLFTKMKLFGQNNSSLLGIVDKSDREEVMEMLNEGIKRGFFPKDIRFMYSGKPFTDADGKKTRDYEIYSIKTKGRDVAPVEGDKVVSASPQLDQNTGQVQVSLAFNSEGARGWGNMTEECFPTRRQIAIALDDEIASAPAVQAVMRDGRSSITGNFSQQEADDLSNILQVGKLPAKTQIIEEAIVGPSLGAKNINSSLLSLGIGLLLVLLFMVFYYGGGGVVSIVALLANIIFIIAALASLGTVLTLPGIAGIVLTVGMAVDANVIIYERIREELRAGKSVLASVRDGFNASYSAIIDANVTTILTALVLFYFGAGPIKGFAAVLIIGVIFSLFAAVLVGRLIIDWWLGREKPLSFYTPPTKGAFSNVNIDWVGARKYTYIISGTIIAIGIASFFMKGFELGVDFKGGYSYAVQFEQPVDIGQVETVMEGVYGAKPSVKTFGSSQTLEITTSYLIDSVGENVDEKVLAKTYEGIQQIVGTDKLGSDDYAKFVGVDSTGERTSTFLTRSIKIGPTIADDITRSSYNAALFALLLIFLYILLRFRKWQYSLGAVAALFHDVLIVLSIFSLGYGIIPFSLEIDQNFIAAILTVIGYSINDTVVVFDRIREFMSSHSTESKKDLINGAVNNTISRTVITSLTTLFVVLILFLFGGGSITGFAFALVVGILVGTYSSVFVATPIVYDLTDELKPKTVSKKKNKYSR